MQTPITGVCPTDCTDITFGAIAEDQNCDYTPVQSEFGDLWIKPEDATPTPFTDWDTGTVTATADSIDNTAGDNSKCIHLIGVGSLEAPEKQTRPGPKFSTITINRTYSVVFRFENLNDANYALLRQFQCNPRNFTYWYGNSTHVFGVETGLIPTFVDVDFTYGEGRESVETAILTLQFDAKIDPERVNNPY